MRRCLSCGGRLRRAHRSWVERLRYQAKYKCKDCGQEHTEDQWYAFLVGGESRCPRCGTYRLRGLTSVDKIDRMYKNLFSYSQKFLGANLHYCPFCRLQFYDLRKRKIVPDAAAAPPSFLNQPPVNQAPDTASSDG
jgi:DNA-directed RNA polymerase subunit RPC12/RpoP